MALAAPVCYLCAPDSAQAGRGVAHMSHDVFVYGFRKVHAPHSHFLTPPSSTAVLVAPGAGVPGRRRAGSLSDRGRVAPRGGFPSVSAGPPPGVAVATLASSAGSSSRAGSVAAGANGFGRSVAVTYDQLKTYAPQPGMASSILCAQYSRRFLGSTTHARVSCALVVQLRGTGLTNWTGCEPRWAGCPCPGMGS